MVINVYNHILEINKKTVLILGLGKSFTLSSLMVEITASKKNGVEEKKKIVNIVFSLKFLNVKRFSNVRLFWKLYNLFEFNDFKILRERGDGNILIKNEIYKNIVAAKIFKK